MILRVMNIPWEKATATPGCGHMSNDRWVSGFLRPEPEPTRPKLPGRSPWLWNCSMFNEIVYLKTKMYTYVDTYV